MTRRYVRAPLDMEVFNALDSRMWFEFINDLVDFQRDQLIHADEIEALVAAILGDENEES